MFGLRTDFLISPFMQASGTWQYLNHLTTHSYNLIRSSYFQLRLLRAIRKSVSFPIVTSISHAFVCSRIDYCNSLLVDLPQNPAIPLQTVHNSADEEHCQSFEHKCHIINIG